MNAALLTYTLHRRLGHLDDERIIQTVVRVIGVTILMALTVQATKYFLVSFGLDLSRAIGVLAQAVVAGGVGIVSFGAFAILFKLEEATFITSSLRSFGQRFMKNGSNGL